jgi:hypothetical protein
MQIFLKRYFFSLISFQEGSIGHEYVLRPVPLDLSQTESGGVHHIIYKRDSNQVDDSDYGE